MNIPVGFFHTHNPPRHPSVHRTFPSQQSGCSRKHAAASTTQHLRSPVFLLSTSLRLDNNTHKTHKTDIPPHCYNTLFPHLGDEQYKAKL